MDILILQAEITRTSENILFNVGARYDIIDIYSFRSLYYLFGVTQARCNTKFIKKQANQTTISHSHRFHLTYDFMLKGTPYC